jgi:hypothetical protein
MSWIFFLGIVKNVCDFSQAMCISFVITIIMLSLIIIIISYISYFYEKTTLCLLNIYNKINNRIDEIQKKIDKKYI